MEYIDRIKLEYDKKKVEHEITAKVNAYAKSIINFVQGYNDMKDKHDEIVSTLNDIINIVNKNTKVMPLYGVIMPPCPCFNYRQIGIDLVNYLDSRKKENEK